MSWLDKYFVSDLTDAGGIFINISKAPYSAVGDGTTDDSSALLLAAAAGEATIYFPPGIVCRTTANVTFAANQTLYFDSGAGLKPDSAKTITINGLQNSCIQARKDRQIFFGSGLFVVAFHDLEFGWFGGIPGTDSTAALQNACNTMQSMTSASGSCAPRLFIHAGDYHLSYSCTLIGDEFHNYQFHGDAGGLQTPLTRFLFTGPHNSYPVTMINAWGLNQTYFFDIGFDGGATTSALGAGCTIWLHTNEVGTVTWPGLAAAPCNGVYFSRCQFTGVVGGLSALHAKGDGPLSPGCNVLSSTGTYTSYQMTSTAPPTTGVNAVDTFFSTTTTAPTTTPGAGTSTTFAVLDSSGFVVNRGALLWYAGAAPWVGRVIGKPDSTHVTIADIPTGTGIASASGSTLSNCYPNVTAPTYSGATVVHLADSFVDKAVQGVFYEKCGFGSPNFYCYDTTQSTDYSHCYALDATYSGANTEQFAYKDCTYIGACFVFYAPSALNNALIFDNCQVGAFSAAFVYVNGSVSGEIRGCGTENLQSGAGYFLHFTGNIGRMELSSNEILLNPVCNPRIIGCIFAAHGSMRRNTCYSLADLSNWYTDTTAQPLAYQVGTSFVFENNQLGSEAYAPCIYGAGSSSELFGDYYGQASAPGTNLTHYFSGDALGEIVGGVTGGPNDVVSRGSRGNNTSGSPIILRPMSIAPESVWPLGLISPAYVGSLLMSYRASPRGTVSCAKVPCASLVSGRTYYVGTLQVNTVIKAVLIATDVAITGSGGFTTLVMNVGLLTAAIPVNTTMANTVVPLTAPALDTDGLVPSTAFVQAAWKGGDTITMIPTFAGTITAGHVRIYVLTEVLTPMPNDL